jgi:hypothetical protein
MFCANPSRERYMQVLTRSAPSIGRDTAADTRLPKRRPVVMASDRLTGRLDPATSIAAAARARRHHICVGVQCRSHIRACRARPKGAANEAQLALATHMNT